MPKNFNPMTNADTNAGSRACTIALLILRIVSRTKATDCGVMISLSCTSLRLTLKWSKGSLNAINCCLHEDLQQLETPQILSIYTVIEGAGKTCLCLPSDWAITYHLSLCNNWLFCVTKTHRTCNSLLLKTINM